VGGDRVTLPDVSNLQGDAGAIVAQCTEITIPEDLLGTADFRPMLTIDWGHGATTVSSDFDVTFRQRIPLLGATAQCFGWIAAFPAYGSTTVIPAPGNLGGPNGDLAANRNIEAHFRAFYSEGTDAVSLFPTLWRTQIGAAAAMIQGMTRISRVRAALPAGSGAQLFLSLFDSAAPPIAGLVPFESIPIPFAETTARTDIDLPFGQTRALVNGFAWGLSTAQDAFAAPGSPPNLFLSAEIEC